MPPHEGDDHGSGAESPVAGLPVRHAFLRPGSVATGALIAGAFAVVAQCGAVFAGLGAADRELLGAPRLRSLGTAWASFAEASRAPGDASAVWRPLADVSLALGASLSPASAGAPAAWWFLALNLLLHAVSAGLVYVLFVNLTKRRLGAPMIAAALFAIHPLACMGVASVASRGELLGTVCGLLSAILLVRSPGRDRLLWTSVALWGIGLFASPCIAALPVVVALALVAYHEVEPRRLLTARLGRRFAVFAIPAVIWFAARWAVAGSPVASADVAFTSGPVVAALFTLLTVFPAGLRPSASGEPAIGFAAPALAGVVMIVGAVAAGAALLRRHAAGFPLLAWGISLAAALVVGDLQTSPYIATAFLLLLVAEGLEHLYYRWGAALGLSVTLVVFVVLPVQDHLLARSLRDQNAAEAAR